MASIVRLPHGVHAALDHGARADAPALLFVHGQLLSHDAWDDVSALLPEHTRLALDLPGHGQSEIGPHFALDDIGRAVVDALELLAEASRVVVVGHSVGCYAALMAALLEPSRIEALVLVGIPFDFDDEARGMQSAIPSLLADGVSDTLVDIACQHWLSAPYRAIHEDAASRVRALLADNTAEKARVFANAYLAFSHPCERLSGVRIPTTIVTGAEDTVMPAERARTMWGASPTRPGTPSKQATCFRSRRPVPSQP